MTPRTANTKLTKRFKTKDTKPGRDHNDRGGPPVPSTLGRFAGRAWQVSQGENEHRDEGPSVFVFTLWRLTGAALRRAEGPGVFVFFVSAAAFVAFVSADWSAHGHRCGC